MARVGNTLVFSFDGTDKEPADAEGFRQDESISNILKLHVLLAIASGPVQRGKYALDCVGKLIRPGGAMRCLETAQRLGRIEARVVLHDVPGGLAGDIA